MLSRRRRRRSSFGGGDVLHEAEISSGCRLCGPLMHPMCSMDGTRVHFQKPFHVPCGCLLCASHVHLLDAQLSSCFASGKHCLRFDIALSELD